MYCTSIAEQSAQRCRELMAGAPMVELRGDLCRLCPEELAEVVGSHPNVLYTCHLESTNAKWAAEQYEVVLRAGARWVDVELGAPEGLIERVESLAHQVGAKLVISYHNYTHTPSVEELARVAERCFALGAEIAKVATTATDTADCITICKLYRSLGERKSALVAFAMGSRGAASRRLSLIEGAPFTFVAPDGGVPTASGQPTLAGLRATMEGHSLEGLKLPTEATPPCSKSYFQRAIVAATLAEGESHLTYEGELCGDSSAAIEWARSLGAKVEITSNTITICGIGSEGFRSALPCTLDVGESALLARLSMGIVASIGGGATIVGGGSLLGRSFEKDIEILRSLGIEVESRDGHLPITLGGAIVGDNIEISAPHSSQLASGLLMGAPLRHKSHSITVANPASRPYLDMTLNVMLLFGIDYGSGYGLTEEKTQPLYFDIGEGERYTGSDLVIEADWSSAGYLLAAAAIAQSGPAQRPEGYRIRGMNFSSHQADRMIMRLLLVGNDNINFIDTHATRRTFDGTSQAVQEICDLVVSPSAPLRPIVCNATDAPDAIPTLAVLALFAQGESRIAGLGRLTNKESDRRGALIAELLALGADIDIEGDQLVVRGGKPLRGASLCAHNDHRMAMALAVATLFIEEPCTLDSLDCVAKSWPSFWEVFGLNK